LHPHCNVAATDLALTEAVGGIINDFSEGQVRGSSIEVRAQGSAAYTASTSPNITVNCQAALPQAFAQKLATLPATVARIHCNKSHPAAFKAAKKPSRLPY
jgi:hypothetical protein